MLQTDPLPSEPPGKPKNTVVSSLSLLQQIFLTQESNWGLLYCRQIICQRSYQGIPWWPNWKKKKKKEKVWAWNFAWSRSCRVLNSLDKNTTFQFFTPKMTIRTSGHFHSLLGKIGWFPRERSAGWWWQIWTMVISLRSTVYFHCVVLFILNICFCPLVCSWWLLEFFWYTQLLLDTMKAYLYSSLKDLK